MSPCLRRELTYVLPSSFLFALGASLVGYYGVHQREVVVAAGIILTILGYRIPQYLLYADTKLRAGISEALENISARDIVSLGLGLGVVAYGIPLGANGLYMWELSLVVLSGLCFIVGYMLIHAPLNNALI